MVLLNEGERALLQAWTFRVGLGAMLLLGVSCFGQVVAAQEKPKAVDSAQYRIAAGDVLHIDVWKQPEITRAIPVQLDGTIRLPLVDEVKVSGLTAMELAGLLRDRLLRFLENPQVTVTVVRMRRTFAPATPILPRKAPQMDAPPAKCCVA